MEGEGGNVQTVNDGCVRNRFFDLRGRLFGLIQRQLERDNCCKSYEGAIEISFEYDDYFSSKDYRDEPYIIEMTLHCYCVGPNRHYTFKGKKMDNVLDQFEKWILDREKEEREEMENED